MRSLLQRKKKLPFKNLCGCTQVCNKHHPIVKRPFEVFNYSVGSILRGNGQKNHVNNIQEIEKKKKLNKIKGQK